MSEQAPESDQSQGSPQPKDSRFYYSTLKSLPGPISELLENYSNIPRASQVSHVLEVRNEAYKAHPYPCLGRFRFTSLDLSTYPAYKTYVLPTLTKPKPNPNNTTPIFLDLGTCLGQDIRKLIHDGVPPSVVYGSDIIESFIDNGYSLFLDHSTLLRSHFLVPADVFAPISQPNDKLHILDDKVDILHVTAVFHLFDLAQQKQIANRCLRLLRKDTNDKVLILGAQAGNISAMESTNSRGGRIFRHNGESWRRLWEEVIFEDGGRWEGVVKDVNVVSLLDEWKDVHATKDEGAGEDQGRDLSNQSKVIGNAEDGFRWHTWEVWLEFQ